ncbi:MAG: hypothetical protein NC344_05760 [Bacteroidales bacterium]|nr:hypothetical protein [Bacteroidales bacterium]MCM1147326.1 hypothetical protein [Bacteroidales bacterium]MCM1206240.1 hypothetical protein [Bacillota bacterium]
MGNERQLSPVAQQQNTMPVGIDFFNPAVYEQLSKLANSSLIPDSYRIGGVVGGKTGEGPRKTVSEAEAIANCMIAFDVAKRINAAPLMVMQNLYIVYGRPSWSSKFLIATINTCGRFEPLKFEMTKDGVCSNGVQNVKCVAWTTTRGVTHEADGTPVTSKSLSALRGTAVTIQMAVDEGWYTKNGSKWRTMPEQMLRYRAASFWCTVYAPELGMGMRTVEENVEDADYVDVTEKVEEEITTLGNKKTISFNDAADGSGIDVDPETGEIKTAPAPIPAENEQPDTTAEEDGPGY